MGNTTTVTQTYIGLTRDGRRVYSVKAATEGDGTSAEVAIPVTQLKKILGTPGFAIVGDDQTSKAYLADTSLTGTTVTLTANAAIESGKTLTVATQVFGN